MKAEKVAFTLKKSAKSFGGSGKMRTFASAFALKMRVGALDECSLTILHRQK